MLALQNPLITMAQVRILFDGVMDKYPRMNKYLKPDSEIVHSPHFESALVKLGLGKASDLTKAELTAVQSLKVSFVEPI